LESKCKKFRRDERIFFHLELHDDDGITQSPRDSCSSLTVERRGGSTIVTHIAMEPFARCNELSLAGFHEFYVHQSIG
jgi:hypothetical protein